MYTHMHILVLALSDRGQENQLDMVTCTSKLILPRLTYGIQRHNEGT